MLRITVRQIFFAAFLCSSFYAFTQFATVYFYVTEFQDFIKDEVKFAPFRERADEAHLLAQIRDAARYYNLRIDPNEIKIRKTATIPGMTWTTLGVDVTYSALVDLSLFQQPLHFHTAASVAY